MIRRLPLLLLAGALACRPAPAPPAPPATTPAAAPAPQTPPPCTANDLTADVVGGDAAMSHRAMTISARNRTAVTCTLTGYPALRFLDSLNTRVPQLAARRGASSFFAPDSADVTLTLAPGDSAWFEISYLGAPVGPPCYTIATLGIVPPADTAALLLSLGDLMCEDSVDLSPFRQAPPPA